MNNLLGNEILGNLGSREQDSDMLSACLYRGSPQVQVPRDCLSVHEDLVLVTKGFTTYFDGTR